MTGNVGSRWNAGPDRDIDRGRRQILLGAAALAIAAPLATLPVSAIAADPSGFVAALSGSYRHRAVELTALRLLDSDRPLALAVLSAAIERDLQHPSRRPALRLYDLYAALGSVDERLALARRVGATTAQPELRARAALWADPARQPQRRIWRTIDAQGQPLGILIVPV